MQRLIAIFAILLVGCVYAQNVGGTTGPCSAVAIPTPYTKPITVYGSNVGAQSYSGGCVSSSSGVVWYTISPPTGVNITLTTCNAGTTFDTVISVYTQTFNNSCSSLTCFAFNDDTSCSLGSGRSSISFASSGLTYYVGVGGYSSSSGTFQLTLTQTNTSSGGSNNPGCGNATRINGPYNPAITVFGSNVGGITGYNEIVNTTCQINLYQFSSWYQIFPVTGQYVNVTTCNAATNFDTILTVVSGNQCSSLNCTARNDDSCFYYNSTSSSVDFYATAESYYVIVSGYSSFTGNFELTIFQGGSSGNGNGTGGGNGTSSATCSNAQVIYPSNGYYGSTAGIPASGFVDACSRYSNRPAVWFQLQNLFSNSSVTLSTCNSYTNFDTVILVYGGSCSSLTCVAYNDDSSCSTGISTSSTLVFYPTTSSYYVVVAAYGSVTGNFLLTVS